MSSIFDNLDDFVTRRLPAIRGWAIAWVLALAAIGAGGLIWRAGYQPPNTGRVIVGEPEFKVVGTGGTMAGRVTRFLPGDVVMTIPIGGTEDRLAAYLASAISGGMTIDFNRIEFKTGSAVLTPESLEQIDNVAMILRAYPKASVTVAGHTDNVGDQYANLPLSRTRAEAVANRLTADGVASDRVNAEGYGSQKPVADNSTESGRAQNRRVALEVLVDARRE